MLIRDLPTGATFRRGLHAYRIVGETYSRAGDSDPQGIHSHLRRDIVRVDGAGGVLHAPAGWTAERDPGRHVDPNVDPDSDLIDEFDPARVPVGGTVRVAPQAGHPWQPIMTVRKWPTPVGSIRVTSKNGTQLVFKRHAVSRDPGRHRGGDDTRPGPEPTHEDVPSSWGGEPDEWAETLQREPFPIPAPALPYAGPWTPDGHGNVRVPLPLVRALLSDLRVVSFVKFLDRAPIEGSPDANLDDWPAAREFILGAREV